MIALALFLATCFLACSNGANDNFKGVALSWIVTLPCAALISSIGYALLRHP